MKKTLLTIDLLIGLALPALAQTNTNAPSPGIPGIGGIIGGVDESATNLFTPGEINLRIGGAYVQKTGEGGAVLAAEKWDVFTPNLGIGAESIQSGQNNAAEFVYVAYRKILGNTAGSIGVGGGYNELDKRPMGVVKLELEHRSTKHLGQWASVGWGFEGKQAQGRGLVIGAGITWAL